MSFSTTTVSPRIIQYKPPQPPRPHLQWTQKPASIASRGPPAAGDGVVDESAVPIARSGTISSEEPATTQRALEADGTSANPFPVTDDDISLCDDSDDEDLPSVQDFLNLSKSRSGTVAATEPQTLPERSGPSTIPGKGMYHPCTAAEDVESRAQESRDRGASPVAQESDQDGDDTKGTGNASSEENGDDEGNVEKDVAKDGNKDDKKKAEKKDDETKVDKKDEKNEDDKNEDHKNEDDKKEDDKNEDDKKEDDKNEVEEDHAKEDDEEDDKKDDGDNGDGGAQQPEHVPAPEQRGPGSRSTAKANPTNDLVQQKDNAQLEILEGISEPEPPGVPSTSPSYDEYWGVKRIAGTRTRNGITEYKICWKQTWLPKQDLSDELVENFERYHGTDKASAHKETKPEKTPARKRKGPATGGADASRRSKRRRVG